MSDPDVPPLPSRVTSWGAGSLTYTLPDRDPAAREMIVGSAMQNLEAVLSAG